MPLTPDGVEPDFYILPAEFVGMAEIDKDGYLDIGGVKILAPWGTVGVYVLRSSDDLSVIEIHMARHDGLAQEELDRENAEAERYPLGPKAYWREKMVGKYRYGTDHHLMTDAEFEEDWYDDDDA